MSEVPRVQLLSSQTLHRGRVFDLVHEGVRLPSGLRQDLDIVRHPGAVGIVALRDCDRLGDRAPEQQLLLVRQYRHALGDWILEIPAGRLEENEEPLGAARRELEEETGHRAEHWELLRRIIPAPGFCSERITLFLARDLVEVPGGGLPQDADEELTVAWMTPRAILESEIEDAKTLLAASLLL